MPLLFVSHIPPGTFEILGLHDCPSPAYPCLPPLSAFIEFFDLHLLSRTHDGILALHFPLCVALATAIPAVSLQSKVLPTLAL